MRTAGNHQRGFTLIEIMVVVAIMGLIMTIAIPNIYQLTKRAGLRRAVSDVIEVCSNARAQAILAGRQMEVVFHPIERRFEIRAGANASAGAAPVGDPGVAAAPSVNPTAAGTAGVIPEDVRLEMLDVNLREYNQSEWTRVRFYPNGTSDELTIIFRSDKNEYRRLSLEPTTGLITQGEVTR